MNTKRTDDAQVAQNFSVASYDSFYDNFWPSFDEIIE